MSLGASALASPLGSFAQQLDKVWRIGVLSGIRPTLSSPNIYVDTFTQSMRKLGYIEGKTSSPNGVFFKVNTSAPPVWWPIRFR